jgi:hypothetical protein
MKDDLPGCPSILNWIFNYLNIPRTLDVLAVVAPVPGGAEPLGAQHPLEHARHLHAVGCLHQD